VAWLCACVGAVSAASAATQLLLHFLLPPPPSPVGHILHAYACECTRTCAHARTRTQADANGGTTACLDKMMHPLPLPLTRLSSLSFACARSPFLRPPSPRPLSCSRSHRPSFLCTRRSARGWRRWAQKSRLPAVCSSVLDPLHPCLCVYVCSMSVCICLMPATDGRMCVCSHVCVRAFFLWHSAFLLWMTARVCMYQAGLREPWRPPSARHPVPWPPYTLRAKRMRRRVLLVRLRPHTLNERQ
jgi:hypothetical protein